MSCKFGRFSLELSIGFKSSDLCSTVIQETFIAHQKTFSSTSIQRLWYKEERERKTNFVVIISKLLFSVTPFSKFLSILCLFKCPFFLTSLESLTLPWRWCQCISTIFKVEKKLIQNDWSVSTFESAIKKFCHFLYTYTLSS